jgi:hypothetical protein
MAITEVARPPRAERKIDFAVVAMPVGSLAHAIDAYRQAVAVRVGENAAHQTPPHCMLVNPLRDQPSAAHVHRRALAALVANDVCRTRRAATVSALTTDCSWHGLEIESPALLELAARFARQVSTTARRDHVTRQDCLRLVLAAGFHEEDREALCELAHRIVDPSLPVEWEVGLWQNDQDAWCCVWREPSR